MAERITEKSAIEKQIIKGMWGVKRGAIYHDERALKTEYLI